MSKEISLLDGPFTFERVDRESFFLQPVAYYVEDLHVSGEIKRKQSNVVDIHFKILGDVAQRLLHHFLRYVWGLTDTHW